MIVVYQHILIFWILLNYFLRFFICRVVFAQAMQLYVCLIYAAEGLTEQLPNGILRYTVRVELSACLMI